MSLYILPLLLILAAAPIARADTYQFDFQGKYVPDPVEDPLNGGPTFSFFWQISAAPTTVIYNGEYPVYEFVSVPITSSAGNLGGILNLSIAPEENPREVGFFTSDGSIYDTYGIAFLDTAKLFSTGLDSNPIFLPGSYDANFQFRTYSEYDGTLTISDLSTVTPEPSTFALLGTGLIGIAGVLRQKTRGLRS